MKSIIFFLSVIVALGVSFLLVGFCAPVNQTTEITKEINCSKTDLWSRLTSIELFAEIKTDVSEVEIIDADGKKWKEFSSKGSIIEYEIIEEIPGEKLVVKVFDEKLNLEKKRVYTIFGSNSSSVLSIKEFVTVEKLLLRSTLAIAGNNNSITREVNSIAEYANL